MVGEWRGWAVRDAGALCLPQGLSSDWGDYSASSMIGVRWKPARRRRPVQNPPQFSIPQPAAIRAIIPLPPRSPQSLDTPCVYQEVAILRAVESDAVKACAESDPGTANKTVEKPAPNVA
jgi:hypothetical protein